MRKCDILELNGFIFSRTTPLFWAKSCFCRTDSTIQKLKQQYNRSGGPALEVTLAEVEENLRVRPPKEINLDEVEFNNGIANGHTEHSAASGKIV